MSTSPVNGYFKQLQDYYVAKAERAHHSAPTDNSLDGGLSPQKEEYE